MFALRRSHFTSVLGSSIKRAMSIKVGDKIPSAELCEGTPNNKVDILQAVKGKRALIFAVPGAFTPGCTKTHLPGYVADYSKIKECSRFVSAKIVIPENSVAKVLGRISLEKNIDLVACISVNDPFVMSAWGEAHKTEGKINMWADLHCSFTKALGMELEATPLLGNVRSKRYAMLVEDGVVKSLFVEPDGTGLTCSLSNSVLDQL